MARASRGAGHAERDPRAAAQQESRAPPSRRVMQHALCNRGGGGGAAHGVLDSDSCWSLRVEFRTTAWRPARVFRSRPPRFVLAERATLGRFGDALVVRVPRPPERGVGVSQAV
eukprot:1333052-Prymnesium_polylepis.1